MQLFCEHWWWRAREEFLLNEIRRLELPNQPQVLDIGCNDGLFFDRLAEFGGSFEGLESDASLVSSATCGRYKIHIGTFDESYQPSKQFDFVLMLDVIEHLPDPQAALTQAVRLLNTTGRIIVTVPAFNCLWTTHDDMNHHYTRYTRRTFRQLATAASMRINQSSYFFHWLAPLKFAVRFKESLIRTSPTPPGIPDQSINQGMLGISRLEQSYSIGALRLSAVHY